MFLKFEENISPSRFISLSIFLYFILSLLSSICMVSINLHNRPRLSSSLTFTIPFYLAALEIYIGTPLYSVLAVLMTTSFYK